MAQVEVNLRDLYRVLRKRKWIIIVAPVLMGLATYTFTEAPPPIYQAETLVRITRSTTLAGLMTQVVSYSPYDNMATQRMIVTSQPVLLDVARRLNLIKPGDDPQAAVNKLKAQISAEQRSESDILAVIATAPSKLEAIGLANTTAEAYIKQSTSERDKQIEQTVQFIRNRLQETTNELNAADQSLGNFKRTNGVSLTMSPTQGIEIQEKRFQYQQKLQDARGALATLTRIQQTKEYDALLQSYFQVDDPAVRALVEEVTKQSAVIAELRNKKADLLRYQMPNSPQVTNISTQVSNEERRLDSQLANLLRRLNTLIAEYQRLDSNMARQQSELMRQPEISAQLQTLEALAKEKQELATVLRKNLQDAEIQQREKVDELTVVERASTARTVSSNSRSYKTAIGFLIGILLGGVLAFILESLDTSIGTIEDVERYISSVVLGVVPHIEAGDVLSRIKLEDFPPGVTDEDLHRFARLTTHFDPKSVASEAYRTMRTNIGSVMTRTNSKVIMITSSVLQEGKTTSTTNLATAFAQTGRKTLLIDGDLRRPHADKIFGIEKAPGLSDVLLGTRELQECYRTIEDFVLGKFGLKMGRITPGLEYLYLLPAGRAAENPAELLNSAATDRLIAQVRERFDVIIIDISPILPVADASILAPKVDGVVLSYQIGRVGRDVLKRSKMRLEALGGKVWGIIMNDIQAEIDYRRGDYQYYTYKYEPAAPDKEGWFSRMRGRFTDTGSPLKMSDKPIPPPPARPKGETPPPKPPPPKDEELRDIMGLTDDEKR
ncbi:MAG TPA: polysaccharide biosynthesis tyrosine autokinase [Acidobacteriota bacterium]